MYSNKSIHAWIRTRIHDVNDLNPWSLIGAAGMVSGAVISSRVVLAIVTGGCIQSLRV